MIVSKEELAKSLDSTLLKAAASEGDIRKLCDDAKEFNFASVVVNPCFVPIARTILLDTPIKVSTVVGFPLGANTTTEKCFETINCIVNGASEIDFVMNIGFMKSRQYEELYRDVKAVVISAKRGQMKNPTTTVITKFIIETCYLTDEEKRIACKIAEKAGVDFVKTSTGLGSAGATEEDIRLLRRLLPLSIGVKASGGIKTLEDADNFLELGATRVGTSSAVNIMQEYLSVNKAKSQS